MNDFLEYQAQDVMTRDWVHVAPATTLAEAEKIFEAHDFNSLPVLDGKTAMFVALDGAFVGIVTKHDLLAAFCEDADYVFPPYEKIMASPVSGVMTPDPEFVWPRTPLTRVIEKLRRGRYKSFPVCDDGVLCGMVAREDILRALRRAAAGERPSRAAGTDR